MTVHPNPLLKDALASCRAGFIAVVVFSLFINVLMLTAPLYTLQIFDRVIAARSGETLLYLSLIAGFALLTLAALEAVRARVMVGLSTWLDRCLGGSILEGSIGARAFSDHSGSYPELTKKFAHSVGVNSSMISAMAAQRSSTVRAAAFLSNALSFEKACSMGLKSGE